MTLQQFTLTDRLTLLASCLCDQIALTSEPSLCFCGVVPGEQAVGDLMGTCDGCGMAWVRLDSAYPANGIATPNGLPGNCQALLGVELEMGVLRCAPAGDDQGNPPPAEALLAAAALQIEDAKAMRTAVECCGPSGYILGTYTPIGPQGGALGGVWTLSMIEE